MAAGRLPISELEPGIYQGCSAARSFTDIVLWQRGHLGKSPKRTIGRADRRAAARSGPTPDPSPCPGARQPDICGFLFPSIPARPTTGKTDLGKSRPAGPRGADHGLGTPRRYAGCPDPFRLSHGRHERTAHPLPVRDIAGQSGSPGPSLPVRDLLGASQRQSFRTGRAINGRWPWPAPLLYRHQRFPDLGLQGVDPLAQAKRQTAESSPGPPTRVAIPPTQPFRETAAHPAAHPNFHRRLLAPALADPVIEGQDLTRSIHDNG